MRVAEEKVTFPDGKIKKFYPIGLMCWAPPRLCPKCRDIECKETKYGAVFSYDVEM